MITAKEAWQKTKDNEAEQNSNAQIFVANKAKSIEEAIIRASKKGEYFCRVYYTQEEVKKAKTDFRYIANALKQHLEDRLGYFIRWDRDIDGDLEVKISWQLIKVN